VTSAPPAPHDARSTAGAVRWLTAQALLFGASVALLGVVANAMFLAAYGAGWLPATYIAIGVAGIVVSGAVARTAQRYDLVGLAVVVLGGAAAGIGLAWVVARDGSAPWVSVPLLVLFPILIQLGFVFLGGQAGRVLDIAGIKTSFPRIVTGFPVGAVVGGILAGQLVAWFGRTEELLLATAVAQAGFAGLVWATGRRYAHRLRAPALGAGTGDPALVADTDRPSMRRLLTSRFVVLILAYQVLSALGSQLSDYLVYDRAGAQFADPADLARYLAGYTAAINIASIAFLFLLAGPLLRRFGLRLGITVNPFVLGGFAVAMLVVLAVAGASSMALLLTVTAARIADLALTDGTTRTSINVTYHAVPERSRIAVQAAVEGIGVPVAIGVSGVVILVCNALGSPLGATLVVTLVVCAAWSWGAVLLYRAYGPALVHALRRPSRRTALDDWRGTADDDGEVLRLLASPDARLAGIGIELARGLGSPVFGVELASLGDDPRPEVRLGALTTLAAAGDADARRRLAVQAGLASIDPDPGVRLLAAQAMRALDATGRAAGARLLGDTDGQVRIAAFEAIASGDTFAIEPALAALADARTAPAAGSALDRLGDAVVPALADRLDRAGVPADLAVIRLVRALHARSRARDEVLHRHVGHPDRDLGLLIMERLVGPGAAAVDTGTVLDRTLDDDAAHAARIVAAIQAIGDEGPRPLVRALRDELDLVRARVAANRLARHGTRAIGPALIAMRAGGRGAGVAAEAIGVMLRSEESRLVLAVLAPDVPDADRLRRLVGSDRPPPAGLEATLMDLVEDRDGVWRSPWLRACAIDAAVGLGRLAGMDLEPARALRDPVIDELLATA
jgi:hypothetical protein